jgi:hypothetical protein
MMMALQPRRRRQRCHVTDSHCHHQSVSLLFWPIERKRKKISIIKKEKKTISI